MHEFLMVQARGQQGRRSVILAYIFESRRQDQWLGEVSDARVIVGQTTLGHYFRTLWIWTSDGALQTLTPSGIHNENLFIYNEHSGHVQATPFDDSPMPLAEMIMLEKMWPRYKEVLEHPLKYPIGTRKLRLIKR